MQKIRNVILIIMILNFCLRHPPLNFISKKVGIAKFNT